MKMKLLMNGDLHVIFETYETKMQLDFLTSLEPSTEEEVAVIEEIIGYVSDNHEHSTH